MHIIFIGTDRNLLSKGTGIYERFARFGDAFKDDVYDSIIFSLRSAAPEESKPTSNVHAYSTRSFSRLFYGIDAIRIASTLSRPNVISAQDPFETGLVAFIISRLLRVPFVVEIHTDFLSPAYRKHSFLNAVRAVIAGFVIPRASGVYGVSNRVRDRVMSTYKLSNPVPVLPIYVEKQKQLPSTLTTQSTTLLWVGRLEKEKQPWLALEAHALALAEGHNTHLVFVGDGSLKTSLEALAQTLDVSSSVTFVGMSHEVASWYARADVLLCTSAYEGYGMVIVEALAAGVPVLSTDVGVAREAGAVIATGSYSSALLEWLKGSRPRGVLTLPLYRDEKEYQELIRAFYDSVTHRI